MTRGERLAASTEPLTRRYDVAILDLDGVVYVGEQAVEGVAERLRAARRDGLRTAFVTNNASRTPTAVARHLTDLGVDAAPADVVTSAQATARLVASQVASSARVLVVGGEGLLDALREHDLEPVARADDDPVAVVQGFAPDVDWRLLTEGTVAVRRGLPWIASNTDQTIPTPRGRAPGNGLLVEVVARTTGRRPQVAGKPEPPLLRETLLRVGGQRPLVVGDRLDTDILGAVRCDLDSLLVLTGVTDVVALAEAPAGQRPSYVGSDLGSLFDAHLQPRVDDDCWHCGGWRVRLDETSGVQIHGDGPVDDALRALVSACWASSGHQRPRPDAISAAWAQITATPVARRPRPPSGLADTVVPSAQP